VTDTRRPTPDTQNRRWRIRVVYTPKTRVSLRRIPTEDKEDPMLWLILGIVLLLIAIAGGAIIHPILFALAIVALVMFFMGRGGRAGTTW
jgi:hypothetical protein